MSASETPRFSIPYPADDAEGWWNVFRDGMTYFDTTNSWLKKTQGRLSR